VRRGRRPSGATITTRIVICKNGVIRVWEPGGGDWDVFFPGYLNATCAAPTV